MKCEFCGKYRKTVSTQFFCNYCKECIEIVIEQCKDALEELREV